LYGCKTWSLTLREEYRLRIFENTALRIIFGHRKNGRRLHIEEPWNFCVSPNMIRVIKSRRMRWMGHVVPMRETRWEDNTRMDLTETGWMGVDWIHLPQDRGQWRAVLDTVMYLHIIQKVSNFLTI
jgi:hypothetical protein